MMNQLSRFTDLWSTIVIIDSKYEVGDICAVGDVYTTAYVYCDMRPNKVVALRNSLYTEGTPQMFDLFARPLTAMNELDKSSSVFDQLSEIDTYDACKDIYHQELHRLAKSYANIQLHIDEQSAPMRVLWLARMLKLYALLSKDKKGIGFVGALKTKNMQVSEDCVYDYFEPNAHTAIAAIFLARSTITRGEPEYDQYVSRALDLSSLCNLIDKLTSFDAFERWHNAHRAHLYETL